MTQPEDRLKTQLKTMMDISRAIGMLGGLDVILNRMLEIALRSVRADHGAILLLDPHIKKLVYRAIKGERRTKKRTELKPNDVDGKSAVGWVVMTGKSVLNPDVKIAGHYRRNFKEVKSNCAVPIPIEGKIEGSLLVESTKPNAFTPEDQALLEAITHIIGAVIAEKRSLLKAKALSEILTNMSGTEPLSERLTKAVV
ncbi:GAF domain-containing protein, partial [Candidatus Poribacteria bacterium]|nr:GAF domain-containing protein [Candidatus Poribacteria bacterium]